MLLASKSAMIFSRIYRIQKLTVKLGTYIDDQLPLVLPFLLDILVAEIDEHGRDVLLPFSLDEHLLNVLIGSVVKLGRKDPESLHRLDCPRTVENVLV